MIKRIIALLLVFALAFMPLLPVRADEAPARPTFNFIFETVYENEYAMLLLDRRNNNIRYVHRATGMYFDTLEMAGQTGSAFTRNVQRSDFELSIITNVFTNIRRTMNSAVESTERGQVEYTPIPHGIRADFTIGDPDRLEIGMFPRYISAERLYEFVLQHMTDAQIDNFFDISPLYSRLIDVDGRPRHIRMQATTHADGSPNIVSIPTLRRLYNFFYEQGSYTFEELAYDNIYWGYEEYVPAMLISLVLEYTLDGPDLIITMPRDGIVFHEAQPFASITLHPYFLSGSVHEEGFIFIPEGSGGIIRFNNGLITEEVRLPVFGSDPLFESWVYREPFERASMPIYGIVRGNKGILAIIEEGAPLATIWSNVSGRMDEFNRVYASFELSFVEGPMMRGVGGQGAGNRIIPMIDTDIRQRFIFLYGDDATYLGMARAYQNYLLERGLLRSNPIPENSPFFVDFIATAPRQVMTFGVIPRTQHFSITSTQNAIDILTSLNEQGVQNIHAQYSHWANGGMLTRPLNRIRPLRSIGGRRGMQNLEEFANEIGANLFPRVDATTFTLWPGRFGAVNRRMLARNIGNQFVTQNFVTHGIRQSSGGVFLLSPVYWINYFTRIWDNITNLGLTNIFAADAGQLLHGNYGRGTMINRVEALAYVTEGLAALSYNGNGGLVMLSNPNAFAFAHADVIVDLPFGDISRRRIVCYYVPFKQMVLENHIPFSNRAYNIDPMRWRGFQEYLMRAIESRAGIKLFLTYESEQEFLPAFSHFWIMNHMFFYTQYQRWENRIAEYYNILNEFHQLVRGEVKTVYRVYENGLRVFIEYSNGVQVFLNYCSRTDWEIKGRVIGPISFEVIP